MEQDWIGTGHAWHDMVTEGNVNVLAVQSSHWPP